MIQHESAYDYTKDDQTCQSKNAGCGIFRPGLAMRIDIEWAIELLYNSVKTGSQ